MKAEKNLQKVDNFAVCLSGLARVVKAPKCLFDSLKLIEITSSPLLTNICAIKGTKLSGPLDFEYLGYFWNNFFVICSLAFLILKDYYSLLLFQKLNSFDRIFPPKISHTYYFKVSYCTISQQNILILLSFHSFKRSHSMAIYTLNKVEEILTNVTTA